MMSREYCNVAYNGKTFAIPIIDANESFIRIEPRVRKLRMLLDELKGSKILADMNSTFDIGKFMEPRRPIPICTLPSHARALFTRSSDARNVLDLPIKFPGSNFRLPVEYQDYAPVVQAVANAESVANPACYDEYYCYFTLRRGKVKKGDAHHEAPCHVDGLQGARWNPKHRINHSYTVADRLKTVYYPQPFDLSALDLAKHDVFWEMNRQVAATGSAHAWTDYDDFDVVLMDAYCVHRGTETDVDCERTWVRLSFETRIFDRLGNAHNPFFKYDWKMVPRDIEQLGLVPFVPDADPSLYRFPWQALDGSPNPEGVTTKPVLRPKD